MFLMHRVELKAVKYNLFVGYARQFLMYRVELKVAIKETKNRTNKVPNVPCGVESDMVEIIVNFNVRS